MREPAAITAELGFWDSWESEKKELGAFLARLSIALYGVPRET